MDTIAIPPYYQRLMKENNRQIAAVASLPRDDATLVNGNEGRLKTDRRGRFARGDGDVI